MLTILLLAVATAATGTCAHLWFENQRLSAELSDLRRQYNELESKAWKALMSNY